MLEVERQKKMSTMPASIVCVGNRWFPDAPGGLDRYIYELAYSLADLSDCVELCGIGLPSTSAESGVMLTNLAEPDRSLLQRLWRANANYRTRQTTAVDAINLHFALYSFPLLNQLPADVPVTFHFHGPWALESDREGTHQIGVQAKRWIEQRVYNRCDRFIVLSKAFGQILHADYHIPWAKINIIPGGVNTDRFRMTLDRLEARAQLGWPRDKFILFTPRRLVHRMGLDCLLVALAEVQKKAPQVWLAIAGKGPLEAQLAQQVADLGLQDTVRFLGFLPEEQLPMAYQAADLTVMPSQSLEGFGLVLLEALACGTPALCTPVGGMPEVLTSFSPALITASAEAGAIADTLGRVITGDIDLPDRASCCRYAVENFSWRIIAQRVRAVLLAPVA